MLKSYWKRTGEGKIYNALRISTGCPADGLWVLPIAITKSMNALFIVTLSSDWSGVISCCMLQNRGNMITWTQCDTQLTTCVNQEKPSGFYFVSSQVCCVHGRQSTFITGTSWRPPVSKHCPNQFCRPELMFQYRNLKRELQDWIYLLCLLHCSGHNLVLTDIHKVSPFSSSLLP